MKRLNFIFILLFLNFYIVAQNVDLQKIEPPNWWVGMQNTDLQLLVYGENISTQKIEINSPLVTLNSITTVDNPNYIFINLTIANDAQAGSFDINFKSKNKVTAKYTYELKNKTNIQRGFSAKDLVYLIMPDRFANGDVNNDNAANMLEQADRNNNDGRHGGDIQGVIDHLDYIKNLGATAIWLNPVLENNSPDYSYHGYATTDFYKVDPRQGTNELYKTFVEKAQAMDMKVIMDVIYNHCGNNHWWINDLPSESWINTNQNFHTTYRGAVLSDPHSSNVDVFRFSAGWFVSTMPDLNQHNQLLANYFIQNTIWWIEYAKINGIRIDTYSYPYQDFMSNLTQRVREEYPDITLLGETWLQTVPHVAYFQGDSPINKNFNTHLNSVTDFPLYYATKDAFNEDDGWTSGLLKLYYVLSQDFLYSDPYNLVIFLDNHDLDRYYTSVGKDIKKFKMGLAFLLTTRGIPVLYYGTEIAMEGAEHMGHGFIRKDFPGGWLGDQTNIFTKTNLSKTQGDALNFVVKLANWRKNNKAVTQGKLMQFLPENNVYTYFRYTDNEAVMVIINNHNSEDRTVDCSRFNEILKDYSSAKEIISGTNYSDLSKIEIKAKSAMIFELYE